MDRSANGRQADYRLTPVSPASRIEIEEFVRINKMDSGKPLVKSLSFQGNLIALAGVLGECLNQVGALPLGNATLPIAIAGIVLSSIGTIKRKKRITSVL